MDLIKAFTDLLPVCSPFYIERLEKEESMQLVHLYLGVDTGATPANNSIHSYYDRTWEHLKLFQYRCFIHCRLPIYQDKTTGKFTKATVNFSRDYSRFTLLYEQEVMRLMKIHHCLSTVARNLGIRIQRVESIYHHYTKAFEIDLISENAVHIAFDETSTRKGHHYITTFVDVEKAQIIGIYDGKGSDCVEKFVEDHPKPEAIKNIVMDMSPAFISGVKRCCPSAQITFDKWHMIKLLHKHLDNLGTKAENFKNHIRLLMGSITDFYQQKNEEQFVTQLLFIADFAQELLPDNPITKTIYAHFEGITHYAKSKLTNAILEGINSKIQVIKRVARGFRYTDNFKKMIRFVFHCGSFQVKS